MRLSFHTAYAHHFQYNVKGLPFATLRERFNSTLLHTDLVDLIIGDDKTHTKALRETAKNVVRSGKPGSIICSFRTFFGKQKKLGFIGGSESRQGTLHVSDGGSLRMLLNTEYSSVVDPGQRARKQGGCLCCIVWRSSQRVVLYHV